MIEVPTRKGALLDLMLRNKEELVVDIKLGGQPWLDLACGGRVQDPERRKLDKKQDLSCGLQKNRFWPPQISAWKNPTGYSTGEKRDPREMIDIKK